MGEIELKDLGAVVEMEKSVLLKINSFKESQEALVAENPYVEIVDNKTYEQAKKSRTALLKGRTSIENQDKVVASVFADVRKKAKEAANALIQITLPSEEKQDSEVKRYEAEKKEEKERLAREAQEREDRIMNRIQDFESNSYEIIQKTSIENVELHKTMLDGLVNVDFDYEEFDILFERAKERVQSAWDAKYVDIQEKEAQRVKNELLELQNKRLVEIMPYVAYGEQVDLTKLSDLSEMHYDMVLSSKKSLFEAEQKDKKEAEERLKVVIAEKEAKAKADKEAIFQIRVKRLEEIGIHNQINDDECTSSFSDEFQIVHFECEDVLIADTIDFENMITDAKLSIEKYKSDLEEAEKQKAIDDKLAKEDAERLKKENKDRVKRLQFDKANLSMELDCLDFCFKSYESENQEIKDFVENSISKIQSLKTELLTELKDL
jgi:septum formation topological specificity factor MinE